MKILAINGSPRKNANTATLLNHALAGAKAEGAETELIHLYDYDFKGCRSCFACKRIGGKSYGKCAAKDGITPILKKIPQLDAVLFGSPIYFGNVTGEMRCFIERLFFPYVVYDAEHSAMFPKKLANGWIYTMNMPRAWLKDWGYDEVFRYYEGLMTRIFGSSHSLIVTDTYQFDDYSKYVNTLFDPELKAKRRRDVFPTDCRKAFDMGSLLIKQSI